MPALLSRVFGPPQFPGDPLMTRRAKLFNLCIWFSAALAAFILIANLLGGRIGIRVSSVALMSLVLTPVLHQVAHRGHLRLASALLLLLFFTAATVGIALLGSIRAPSLGAFSLVVVISGTLFGYRGLLASCTLSSAAVAGLILAEHEGLLPAPDFHVGITQWLTATMLFVCLGGLTFSVVKDLHATLAKTEQEIAERQRAEMALRKSNEELAAAMASVRTLKGFLPVCAWCRKVREDDGYWKELETYVTQHTDARITHGICPTCREKNFGKPVAKKVAPPDSAGPA